MTREVLLSIAHPNRETEAHILKRRDRQLRGCSRNRRLPGSSAHPAASPEWRAKPGQRKEKTGGTVLEASSSNVRQASMGPLASNDSPLLHPLTKINELGCMSMVKCSLPLLKVRAF